VITTRKVVTLLSAFVEIYPLFKVKRFSKKENKSIEINCTDIMSVDYSISSEKTRRLCASSPRHNAIKTGSLMAGYH